MLILTSVTCSVESQLDRTNGTSNGYMEEVEEGESSSDSSSDFSESSSSSEDDDCVSESDDEMQEDNHTTKKNGKDEAQCKSPEDALKVANAGINKAYLTFQFISKDGKTTTSFAEAMSRKNDSSFFTGFVKGELSAPKNKKCEVQYKGKSISGDELRAQVKKWVDYGTIEPSAGEAILNCADHPEWLDLSDRCEYFLFFTITSSSF